MAVVRGPYDQDDFRTMQNLKFDVETLSRIDKEKYKFPIRTERKLLKELLCKEEVA